MGTTGNTQTVRDCTVHLFELANANRAACQIFCQDMALCVFRKTSPFLSPIRCDVEMPSYESCWNAENKLECLEQLRSLPAQLQISTAIQGMGINATNIDPVPEVSAFGMLMLILSQENPF